MDTEIPTSEVASASASEPEATISTGQFMFNGSGWGYTKIYIVNMFLTIATFGIYSAWAKVRTRRYFFGNTTLDGHNFEFDAKPTTILLSRIVIVMLFSLATISDNAFGLLVAGFGLVSSLLLLLLPFVVVRGRAFNCRHTLHRSVRLRYQRIYQPTIRLYLSYLITLLLIGSMVWSLTIGDSLGILSGSYLLFYLGIVVLVAMPTLLFMQHSVQINQLCFGKLESRYLASFATYLRLYAKALVIGLLVVLPFFLLAKTVELFDLWIVETFCLIMTVVVWMVYRALLVPLYWSSIQFSDGSKLQSAASAYIYFWAITVLNFILMVISFGLLYPLTVVRRWRYLAAHTQVNYSPEFQEISAGTDRELSPLAEEFADVADFDFDFGI